MSELLRSPKGRFGVIVVGGLLLAAAVWFLLVSPQRSKASDLSAQVDASRTELAQRQSALARPAANVTVRSSDLYRLSKALPDQTSMSGILLDVNRLAAKNKLAFRSIEPTAAVLGTGYVQQPISLIVQGRFGNVSTFLGDLRSLVKVRHRRLDTRGRLYSVTHVEMTQPDNEQKFPIVETKVTLNAYSFSAPVPAPATDPSTTTADSSASGSVAAGATP